MSIIGFANISYQGRLTDDPEVRTLDSGNTVCRFSVAVNRRLPNGDEKTAFIPTTVFGRQGQVCGEFLSKGREVFVTGEFETDKYTDKKGVARTGFGCVARDVIFGSGGTKENREEEEEEDDVSFEDLPEDEKRAAALAYVRGGRGRKR